MLDDESSSVSILDASDTSPELSRLPEFLLHGVKFSEFVEFVRCVKSYAEPRSQMQACTLLMSESLIKMFSGLRSPCAKPNLWMAARPRQT